MCFDAEIPNERATPRPYTCWRNRTPFQTGLILVLTVAVPFFIALLLLYGYSFAFRSQSEPCSRLCGVVKRWKSYRPAGEATDYPDYISDKIKALQALTGCKDPDDCPRHTEYSEDYDEETSEPEGSDKLGNVSGILGISGKLLKNPENETSSTASTTRATESGIKKDTTTKDVLVYTPPTTTYNPGMEFKRSADFHNQSFCFDESPLFPSIAALMQTLYIDDDEELVFKCPVAVLAPNWVLTVEECLRNDTQALFVRINSDYWSKGGILKEVENIVKFRNFLAIQLVEDDKDNICFKPINSNKPTSGNGQVLFWNGDITLPLRAKSKYAPIKAIPVDVKKSEEKISFGEVCEGQVGAVLLDQNQNLVGFHLFCEKGLKELPYRSVDEYFQWWKKNTEMV